MAPFSYVARGARLLKMPIPTFRELENQLLMILGQSCFGELTRRTQRCYQANASRFRGSTIAPH
jgi:hypothetical protein